MKKNVSEIMLMLLLTSILALTFNVRASGPVYFPLTGHYYEAITVSGDINWNEARSQAESLSYLGMQGHLVTIASEAENDFIINNLGGAVLLNRYWLGGFQPPGSPEPDGNWQLVTSEPWIYANWSPGEPTNLYAGEFGGAPAGSDEEVLHFWGNTGQWNDMEESSYQPGFIVEYESSSVGGVIVPVDKFGLLAPYIGLSSTIIVATIAASIYVKRVKPRKEKQ